MKKTRTELHDIIIRYIKKKVRLQLLDRDISKENIKRFTKQLLEKMESEKDNEDDGDGLKELCYEIDVFIGQECLNKKIDEFIRLLNN